MYFEEFSWCPCRSLLSCYGVVGTDRLSGDLSLWRLIKKEPVPVLPLHPLPLLTQNPGIFGGDLLIDEIDVLRVLLVTANFLWPLWAACPAV